MTKQRQEEINLLADEIRSDLELSTPLDPKKAVKRLNGKIKLVDFGDNDIEGKIEKAGDSFIISVPRASSINRLRRRFTISHELGHLFLHMGYLIDMVLWESVQEYVDGVFYRKGYSVEEREAHEFAGAFLMPKKEFFIIARKAFLNGSYQIEEISKHFGVSTNAALMRGRYLGIFAWD